MPHSSDPWQPLFWLTFADLDRPEGEQFLGACLVHASCLHTAILSAEEHQCYPGGQVAMVIVPPDRAALIAERWLNRLLTREEIADFDRELLGKLRFAALTGDKQCQ